MTSSQPVLLLTLVFSAALSAASCQAATEPAQDVRAQVERTLQALAAMDLAAFTRGLAPDVQAFDTDLDGKPVHVTSREAAARFAEDTVGVLRKSGALVEFAVRATDCRADTPVAYCAVDFDYIWTTPDGVTQSQPSRESVVLRHGEDGWTWVHWHRSSSSAPAPPK